MNEKGNVTPIRAETVPSGRHIIFDKDGNRHGPFNTLDEVRAYVAEHFPGQEQSAAARQVRP